VNSMHETILGGGKGI